MTLIRKFVTNLCDIYNESEFSEGIKYVPEFPNIKQDLPLAHSIVSIGTDKVIVSRGLDGTTIQEDSSPTEVQLKFCICVPKSRSGYDCYKVFDKFLSTTKSLLETYSIIDIRTETIKYSTTINGLILPVQMTVSVGNIYTPSEK